MHVGNLMGGKTKNTRDTGKVPGTGQGSRLRTLAVELALGLLVLALLSYTWMFRKVTVPNERTRVYLAVAMVDDHSLSINGPVKRFGTTNDIARKNGRYYTDKAPGASLLAACVYGALRVVKPPGAFGIERLVQIMRSWLMIPIGLLGFFLLRRLLRSYGIGRPVIDVASLGWILGTSAFHYSTAFYGHQIVAVCLLASLMLVEEGSAGGGKGVALWRMAAAGATAGLAGLTEYQAVIPGGLLFLYVLVRSWRQPAKVGLFALGAVPFAVMLLAYNWIAFGGPFELSYQHLVSSSVQKLHQEGIGGVARPRADAILGSLFSLHRGLLATSPVFVLLPVGLVAMWKKKRMALSLLLGLGVAYFLWFVFSARVWYAGWSFGPRLLVPILAWAVILVAFALDGIQSRPWLTAIAIGLVVWGVAYHQSVHMGFAEIPPDARNPMLDVILPAMRRGVVSPNLGQAWFDLHGVLSVIPAMGMASLAILIVLLRGTAGCQRPGQRIAASAGSILIALLLVVAIGVRGPAWKQVETNRFVNWMARLEKGEERTLTDLIRELTP